MSHIAQPYNALTTWQSFLSQHYQPCEGVHRCFVDSIFSIAFIENVLDPDEPHNNGFQKRVNIYSISLRDGLSTGPLERSFAYVPGNVEDAITDISIVHVKGISTSPDTLILQTRRILFIC